MAVIAAVLLYPSMAFTQVYKGADANGKNIFQIKAMHQIIVSTVVITKGSATTKELEKLISGKTARFVSTLGGRCSVANIYLCFGKFFDILDI